MRKLYSLLGLIMILFAIQTMVTFSTHYSDLQYQINGYKLQEERAQHYKDYAISRGLEQSHPSILRADEVIKLSTAKHTESLDSVDEAEALDIKEAEEERLRAEAERDSEIIILRDKLLSDNIDTAELLRLQELITEKIEGVAIEAGTTAEAGEPVDPEDLILTEEETQEILREIVEKLNSMIDTPQGQDIDTQQNIDTETKITDTSNSDEPENIYTEIKGEVR